MYDPAAQPIYDVTDQHSHAVYLLIHPEEGFLKIGVAHLSSGEIRNYVMAGCQVAQLVFMSRNDAHQLASVVLRTVPDQARTISCQHSILGDAALRGHHDSWTIDGGFYDLAQTAQFLGMPHVNAFVDLPYEVVRTTLGVPRLPWQSWRLGSPSHDYTEPNYPARNGIARGSLAHQTM
jgi:hypothetical protein